MNPNLRGVIAESAIAAEAVRLGFELYLPAYGSPRADMILGVGERLLRVQCKSAPLRGEVVVMRARTCRRTASGFERGTYTPDEIDVVAGYCPELNRCYAVPINEFEASLSMYLRLSPARNGQRAGLHFAEDYSLGAIAQLEERLGGTQKVAGSSPASSTPTGAPAAPVVVGAHEFRNRFGWYMERATAGEEILVTHRGRPRIRVAPVYTQPELAVA